MNSRDSASRISAAGTVNVPFAGGRPRRGAAPRRARGHLPARRGLDEGPRGRDDRRAGAVVSATEQTEVPEEAGVPEPAGWQRVALGSMTSILLILVAMVVVFAAIDF